MSDFPIFYLILLLVVVIVLYQSIAIAAENERFAMFFLGRFQAFKGPGLILKTNLQKAVRLAVGDIGEVTSSEFVRFGGVDIPVARQARLMSAMLSESIRSETQGR
jgi:regulator of protease activity HflC (stomatin/prohibitin superfamily)